MRKSLLNVKGNITLNLVSQVIAIASIYFLSKIYSIKDYGELATYVSLSAILSIFSTYRLEVAALSATDQNESQKLLSSAVIFSAIFCLIAFLLIMFLTDIKYAIMLSLIVFLTGLSQVITNHLITKNMIIKISIGRLVSTFFTVTAQVVFGLLVIRDGLVFGYIAGLVLSIWYMQTKVKLTLYPSEFLTMLTKQKEYGFLIIAASAINSAVMQAPQLVMNFLFGSSAAGAYAIAQRFSVFPLTLVSQPLGQSFSAQCVSSRASNQKIDILIKRYFTISIVISLAFFIAINLIVPLLIDKFFDESWHKSIKFILPCSVLLIPTLIMGVIGTSLSIIRQAKVQLLWDSARLIFLLVIILLVRYLKTEDTDFLFLYVINLTLFAVAYFLISKSIASSNSQDEQLSLIRAKITS